MRYDITDGYSFRCAICGKIRESGKEKHHSWCPAKIANQNNNRKCPRCKSKAINYDSDGWGICLDCGKHGEFSKGFGVTEQETSNDIIS